MGTSRRADLVQAFSLSRGGKPLKPCFFWPRAAAVAVDTGLRKECSGRGRPILRARDATTHFKFLFTIMLLQFRQLIIRKSMRLAETAMERSHDRQLLGTERPAASDAQNEILQFRRDSVATDGRAVTAIGLVDEAAQVVQFIEDSAAEIAARAHDLARRAAEQLKAAEAQIRAVESRNREVEASLRAAEANLRAANARADQAEQKVKAAEAQIAAMEDRVFAAEHRASNAEAHAIEAEKVILRVEDAIRNQLLGKRNPLIGKPAQAA
jgi:methyl-accepting chemotaxis protein